MKEKLATKKINHISKLYEKTLYTKNKGDKLVSQINSMQKELKNIEAEYQAQYRDFILAVQKIKKKEIIDERLT